MAKVTVSDKIQAYTYEEPSEYNRIRAMSIARNIMTLCRNNHIAPKNLLEIGAGDGAILKLLSEADFCPSMHAVEISATGVAIIANQGIQYLEECSLFDGYTLDYPDKYFDLIILAHVLEHVEYERTLLREIRRVGKHVVIEVPLDYQSLADDVCISLLPSYGHINVYLPKILKFLLHTEGFAIIDDLLKMTDVEVLLYDNFEHSQRRRTYLSVRAFSLAYRQKTEAFYKQSRSAQEEKASVYTVLACEATKQQMMRIKLNAAIAILRRDNIHQADIIIHGCKSVEDKIILLTDILAICLAENRNDAAEHYSELLESFK